MAKKTAKKKLPVKKLVKAKVKKAVVKKSLAKKPAAKKLSAKKSPVKKSLVKKSVAKKRVVKRPVVSRSAVKKPTVKRASAVKIVTWPETEQVYSPLVTAMLKQLDDAKAENIVTLDLVGKSTMADTMIVASGRSSRHVNAIADQIATKLREFGQKNVRVEGIPQCDWVLVDSGDVIVHIFRPEVRSFYNLEKLWSANAPQDPSS